MLCINISANYVPKLTSYLSLRVQLVNGIAPASAPSLLLDRECRRLKYFTNSPVHQDSMPHSTVIINDALELGEVE